MTASPNSGWDDALKVTGNRLTSIIMPAHNLGRSIAANIGKVVEVFSASGLNFEIVVVDDGSSDSTFREISTAAAANPAIICVRLEQNSGKGAALKKGFRSSRGDFIIFLDADLDLPPGQAKHFFTVMEQSGSDIVIGCKMHRHSRLSYPMHRRIMSRAYFVMVKLLMGLPLHDTQTGLKLFRRAALEAAFPRMLVKAFAFDLELLAIAYEAGFTISEAPVELTFQKRAYPFKATAVIRTAIDTLAIFYRIKVLHYYKSIPSATLPNPAPLVSVIIACPAWSSYLDECVQAITSQDYEPYEVLVLPDNPTGREWSDPRIREIPTGPIRPAEKRNKGILEANGSLCAFLDDDAFPMDDWMLNAVLPFCDPDAGAAGGPAVTPPGDPAMAQLGGKVFSNPLVSGNYRYRYAADRARQVEDFPSCNLIARTDLLRQIGGFRTDFWPGEDTYLCMEIVKKLGKKIFYDPRIMAGHHRRKLFLPHLRQIGRYALHRGFFARKFPATSRKISYAMPSLFVAGLLGGGLLSCVFAPVRQAYFTCVSLYLAVTLMFAADPNPVRWLIIWLGIISSHIVYGARFAAGLFSKQMPETVQFFDHPSQV